MTAPTGGLVPEDQAARDPMLERLDVLVGEWSIEAVFAPGVTGRAVFEWVLGGQFLMERSEAPDFTPLDFWQRFTGEFSADGRTITGRWETSQDGSTWEQDFDLTYRKVS
jgi:hypothetical protein